MERTPYLYLYPHTYSLIYIFSSIYISTIQSFEARNPTPTQPIHQLNFSSQFLLPNRKYERPSTKCKVCNMYTLKTLISLKSLKHSPHPPYTHTRKNLKTSRTYQVNERNIYIKYIYTTPTLYMYAHVCMNVCISTTPIPNTQYDNTTLSKTTTLTQHHQN